MNWVTLSVLMGIGATLIIDLWVQFLKHVAGLPATDWGVVGRWLHQLFQRRTFVLRSDTAPAPYERPLGWAFHYLVGAVYGLLYMGLLQVASLPVSLWSAIAFGLATVLAPWLILQPGLGKGRFAAKTPRPGQTRVLNIVVHSIFGLGLYLIWRVLA